MKPLALILCESSGIVREAFRACGVDAYSCDLLPADDGSPFHLQMDMREAVRAKRWAFIGAHLPCTYVCGSGIHWNSRRPERAALTEKALEDVRWLFSEWARLNVRGYLENPVGVISTRIAKPDQIVQPYQFGDDASKATCLWLNRLPPLPRNTDNFVAGRLVTHNGKQVRRWSNQTDSGQNRLPPSADRSRLRSLTYPGIAAAMATQWIKHLSR